MCIFAFVKRIFLHIEYLLLEHDCVIIPQLGGFFAQEMPSEWIEDEALFLPPYRTVHFNESLRQGNSLLVDTLAEAYSIAPSEAEKQVAQFVQQVKMELLEQGSIDFGSIGVMMQESASQPITFSPCKAGVTTPGLYGLDALRIEKLQKPYDPIIIETADNATGDTPHNARRQYVVRLNRTFVHAITAVAASLILFVLTSTPLANTGHSHQTQANLFVPYNLMANEHRPAKPADRPQDAAAAKPEPTKPEKPEVAKPEESETARPEEPSKPEMPEPATPAPAKTAPEKTEKGFAIVLASVTNLANAEAFAVTLQSQGYDAHVYQREKMVRVIIPCYESREKAVARMRVLKNVPALKDAWITPLN